MKNTMSDPKVVLFLEDLSRLENPAMKSSRLLECSHAHCDAWPYSKKALLCRAVVRSFYVFVFVFILYVPLILHEISISNCLTVSSSVCSLSLGVVYSLSLQISAMLACSRTTGHLFSHTGQLTSTRSPVTHTMITGAMSRSSLPSPLAASASKLTSGYNKMTFKSAIRLKPCYQDTHSAVSTSTRC